MAQAGFRVSGFRLEYIVSGLGFRAFGLWGLEFTEFTCEHQTIQFFQGSLL